MLLDRCRVHVPATSANLGPGFDALGMALDQGMEVVVERADADRVTGRGEAAELTSPEGNLVFEAASALYGHLGRVRPPLAIACDSRIPLARGLGSSAAAVCAGLLAANALEGEPLDRAGLLAIATRLEGHPDNVAPALYGGITVAVAIEPAAGASPAPAVCQVPLAPGLESTLGLVLAIPHFRLSTKEARAALPAQVSHADATFNAGRAALLVAALASGRLDLLACALEDRLHQPYRARLIPGMPAVIAAARGAGALGVTISGAGPSLLAWCERAVQPAVAEAMAMAWQGHATVDTPAISLEGARIL